MKVTKKPLRIGIFASGRGSNFQSIIDAIHNNNLDAEIAVLITDNPSAFAIERAKKHNIDYQIEAAPRATGTDANVIQLTRSGVATGLISFPNRYMHTPIEIVSLRDIGNAVKLAGEFVKKLHDKIDFTPKV